MSLYIPIFIYSYGGSEFDSIVCGVCSSNIDAIHKLIKCLVDNDKLDFDLCSEYEGLSMLKNKEELITYLCSKCSNFNDLEFYISKLQDSYYKHTWKYKISKIDC
jgi:hypothetical protein